MIPKSVLLCRPFFGKCSCGIPVPAPEKPKPQVVIKHGDSSDAIGLSPITITLKTELDLTGCTLTFSFLGFSQTFSTFTKDDDGNIVLTINMTSEQTSQFPLGFQKASVSISDGNDNIRTLIDNILVLVTDSAEVAYGSNNNMVITINLDDSSTVRHLLNGQSWNAGGTIGSLRDFLAKIGEALGANITERETP